MVDAGRAVLQCMELPFFMRLMLPKMLKRVGDRTKVQGIGHHTHAEVEIMGKQNLAALSTYLGKWFLSDCTVHASRSVMSH